MIATMMAMMYICVEVKSDQVTVPRRLSGKCTGIPFALVTVFQFVFDLTVLPVSIVLQTLTTSISGGGLVSVTTATS